MTSHHSETIRNAVQALSHLPTFLKPFTVEGTKLRLPKDIGDPLCDLVAQLRPMLDSVHYEGVQYDYQDEEQESSVATPLAGEAGVNEAFAKCVGQRIDGALICIERARRIADVCGAAVEALECEDSADIALTIGNELFEAIDGARKALEGGQPS